VLDRARRDAIGLEVTRSVEQRIADVRRLLSAARAVYGRRHELAPAIAASTGLSHEGVELGFTCLERDASDTSLRALVASAGDARQVHVILSANVFVAPLRALAVARAAGATVTVRASPRDPTLASALVAAACDPSVSLTFDRRPPSMAEGQIHVYGRDETIAAVRRDAPSGVTVRGHGAGLGIAVIGRAADLDAAAEGLALDVVLFDQRGCMSPRAAFVEGDAARADAFASTLHDRLVAWDVRAPRGALGDAERTESRFWRDTRAFSGRLLEGDGHAVALVRDPGPMLFGPTGRHVGVCPVACLDEMAGAIAPVAASVVAVGTDDVARARAVAPSHARLAPLGGMHSPPLDGPVDLRNY
jgi:hypothetical protein